jgi:hypothetical protein
MRVHVEFVVDKVTLGQNILGGLRSSHFTVIPSMLCKHSSINIRMGNGSVRDSSEIKEQERQCK